MKLTDAHKTGIAVIAFITFGWMASSAFSTQSTLPEQVNRNTRRIDTLEVKVDAQGHKLDRILCYNEENAAPMALRNYARCVK